VEGPVLGKRAMQNYLKASGGQRLGKRIQIRLSGALTQLERDELIICDNPTRTKNAGQKTYRLPSQPIFDLRVLGERTLYDVPHMELRELMYRISPDEGLSTEQVMRQVLSLYGLSRLEQKAEEHMTRIKRIPRI
jgi:hypothetical protein